MEPNGAEIGPASSAPRSPAARIVGFSVWSGAMVGALALVVAKPYFFGADRVLLIGSVLAWVCGGLVGVCVSPLVFLLLRNRNLMAARPIVLWPTAVAAAVLADVWRDDRVFSLIGLAPLLFVAAGFVAWWALPCVRSVPGRCRFCGYDLRGSVEFGRCPECGKSFEDAALSTEALPAGGADRALHPVFAFLLRWPSVPIIAVVLTLLVSSIIVDKRRNDRGERLDRGLAEALRTGARFDLAACTPFEWDAVYIFADRTSAQIIEEALGFRWRDAARSGITIAQRFNLLVFVRGRAVVEYLQVPWQSWFATADTACRIPRARAVFTIRTTEHGDLQFVTSGMPETGDELTADEILKRMRRVYAQCKSYADQGEVTQVFFSGEGKMTMRVPFQTWFVRPERFRFEFRHQIAPMAGLPWGRYVVWADGQSIHSYWTVDKKLSEFESVGTALAGPTGVSGGSAVMIPALLMREMVWGSHLRHVAEAKLLGTELLGEVKCYKIDGRYVPDHGPVTLWIDAQTYLLWRVLEKMKITDTELESTFDYRPTLDGEIPKAVFNVDPSTVVQEKELPPG